MTIPSVDLADFTSGDKNKRNEFVLALGRAYEEVGFVAVKNHGVSDEVIADLYQYVQRFFSLPLEIKRKYEIHGMAGQRGYTSFGKEHAKGSEAPDLKEFFQYGQLTEGGQGYPPNVKVDIIPRFNKSFDNAFQAFEKSGGII